ncbi:hypothetical protein R5W23_005177 [Gemmata sp. JC673]|uniref:Uncharacterized protein n=1 Tax=Gemmata algarum TaxID=2975278 RepID=A0ABU5FAX1_9BACT|nr:hypothetical protein [Gemmata algarum]MDY3563563.1 hypothetical protein [Gemmata algarum]
MSDSSHLLDLTSQAAAVQRLLRGRSEPDKLEWVAARGRLERVATAFLNARPTYRFVSTVGMECVFFINGDEFVFIGGHTTFTVNE